MEAIAKTHIRQGSTDWHLELYSTAKCQYKRGRHSGVAMKYQKDVYQEHLAALEAMRTDVETQLTHVHEYTPLLFDSTGPLPSKLGHSEPEFDVCYSALRIDLSKGTVTMEHYTRLDREHKLLTEMNVPHDYSPAGKELDADERHPPASITLSISDALQYLPSVVKRAHAIRDAELKRGRAL